MQVKKFQGKTVFVFKRTYIYGEELMAVLAIVVIFLVGCIIMQLGKQMDAEVERQRQVEMAEIAHDKLVNQEVTK